MQKIRCHWLQLLAIWSYYATINARFQRLKFFNCCSTAQKQKQKPPPPLCLCCCYHLSVCLSSGILAAHEEDEANQRAHLPRNQLIREQEYRHERFLLVYSRRAEKSSHHFSICHETRVSGEFFRKMLKSLSGIRLVRKMLSCRKVEWKEAEWLEVEITIAARE